MPVTAGLSVRYNFTPRWGIGTGISYSMLNRTFTGSYTEVTDGAVSRQVTAATDNALHYIGVPVNVYYSIISRGSVKLYTYGGGMIEKGIANKFVVHDSSEDIRYSQRVPGVQWSVAAGLGVEFRIAGPVGIYIDPSLRYYFPGEQPRSIRTQQPLTMNFEIGLRAGF